MLSETGRLPDAMGSSVTPTTISPGWTLEIAARVAAAFQSGRVISLGQIQRSTGLSRVVTRTLLNALVDAGIVHEIDGRRGYGLARPAHGIPIDDLLNIHKITEQRQTLVRVDAPDLYRRFHATGKDGFRDKSLEDLVNILSEPKSADIPEIIAPIVQRRAVNQARLVLAGDATAEAHSAEADLESIARE